MSVDHEAIVRRLQRHIELATARVQERAALVARLKSEGREVAQAEHQLRWTEYTLDCLVRRLALEQQRIAEEQRRSSDGD